MTLMQQKSAFSIGYTPGLKSRIVGKHGKVLKSSDDYSFKKIENQGMFKSSILHFEQEISGLEEFHRQYINSKETFIDNYVRDDENEIIDFDEVKGSIVRKTEKILSHVDESSLARIIEKVHLKETKPKIE